MIYRFKLVSDEVNNFSRVIDINSDGTFLELRDAILDSVGYSHDNIDSFFLCTDEWEKQEEIMHEDLGLHPSDKDTWLMSETRLDELIEDTGQKLVFLFDNLAGRAFFMELKKIVAGKSLPTPECSQSVGKPPKQETGIDEVEEQLNKAAKAKKSDELDIFDETFEDGYDEDDYSRLNNFDQI